MTLAYNMYRAAEAAAAKAAAEAREEGISLGITQGAYQKAIETAKNALSMNLTPEQIASLTGLSVEVIQDLASK